MIQKTALDEYLTTEYSQQTSSWRAVCGAPDLVEVPPGVMLLRADGVWPLQDGVGKVGGSYL